MTLARGDRFVKLNRNTGQPVDPAYESYVEYEITDLSPTFEENNPQLRVEGDHNDNIVLFLKARKVR